MTSQRRSDGGLGLPPHSTSLVQVDVSFDCAGATNDGTGTAQMETGALDALAARRRT